MVVSENRRIKVAMIIQDYLPRLGGAERQLAALAPLLKERGVDVHILTRRFPGLNRFESVNGVPIYRLPIFKTKALASLTFTLAAIPVIRSLRPDVIHAHGLMSPTTTAVLAKRLLGTPVVSKTLRGGLLGDLARLTKKPFGRRRFHFLQKQVDAFITISSEIQEELLGSGVSPDRCIFIPNGVKLDQFQPVSKYQKELLRKQLQLPDGLLVIYVGRLEPEKRVDDLIQIWSEIRRKYTEVHLLVLGIGTQEEKLKRMADRNVLFGGSVDNVAEYLQTADLFVLPSVSEGLSNALLEALATGLPVVVTATGGATDIVHHKVSGWLIYDYDLQNLREGIVTFLDNQLLREQCALEGQQYVTENYSLISTANKLCNLYNTLLSK